MSSQITTRKHTTIREMRLHARNMHAGALLKKIKKSSTPVKAVMPRVSRFEKRMRTRFEMESIEPSSVIVGEYDAKSSAVDLEKQFANKIFSSRFFDVVAGMNSCAEPHVVLLDTEYLVSTREILECCPNAHITIIEIDSKRAKKIEHAIAGMHRVTVVHAEITEYLRENTKDTNCTRIDALFLDLMCTQIPNMQSVLNAVQASGVQLLAVTLCLRDRSGIPYPEKWKFMRKQIETVGLYADTNWVYHSHAMMMALSIHTKIARTCMYRRRADGRYPGWGNSVPPDAILTAQSRTYI